MKKNAALEMAPLRRLRGYGDSRKGASRLSKTVVAPPNKEKSNQQKYPKQIMVGLTTGQAAAMYRTLNQVQN